MRLFATQYESRAVVDSRGRHARSRRSAAWLFALMLALAVACSPPSRQRDFKFRALSISDNRAALAWHESAQVVPPTELIPDIYQNSPVPVFQEGVAPYWDLTLAQTIDIAMSNSQVLRDLGGRLVSQPNQAVTVGISEINRSDPRAGIAAALSAFDAQWKGTMSYTKSENGLRAPIIGSTIDTIQQQKGLGAVGFSKIGQAGTRYSVTHGTLFDADNVGVPPNRLARAYDTFVAFEGRHPLARGGGRTYNAVAGPNSPFGTYNGYWIASVRGDIAEDELRIAMRDYTYNVIRAYWLLRFAYDSVEARKKSMDIARDIHMLAQEKFNEGVLDETTVMQTEEKFLAAQQVYENTLAGPPERALAGILGPNGSLISGTELGLRPLERRLRLLIGIPSGQGGLLRPVDCPSDTPTQFDYQCSLASAFSNRPELKRQAKVVELKRMEWLAARNLRLPSVDIIGQYRVHGFGGSIFGDANIRQNSSVGDFLRGDLQDLTGGVEVVRPAGNRLAGTAERNAILSMTRENSILDQQRLEISHEVASAISEVDRSWKALERTAMRLDLAYRNLEGLTEKFTQGIPIPKESILEVQKGVADLELALSIARIDHCIAQTSLALARGTLLADSSIYCGSGEGFVAN